MSREVESLAIARAKLNSQIDVHAPLGVHILRELTSEFEAAVREDERAHAPQLGVDGSLSVGTTPLEAENPPPPPETKEGEPDAPVSIPEGTTDVQGTPLPETLPASVADSVAQGEPLREVSDAPPEAPANGKKNGKKGK